jgi:hypothetical protein
LILAAAALALAACGGEKDEATTSAPTTVAATTVGETTVKAFFYRNAALVPVGVHVPATPAVARAALEGLLTGAPSGYDTTLAAGAKLLDVTVTDGLARAMFSSELGKPSRTAQAQIVATLSQFPTVHGVRIDVEGTGVVPLEDGSGDVLTRPATSADYVDLTALAPIFVRTPARDSTLSSPVRVAGTADVFEATLAVDVWSGTRRLATQTITASAGSGTRGTWSATLVLPTGPVKLVFYEPSAEDGRPLHPTVVELTIR